MILQPSNNFFSGFSLKSEEKLFEPFRIKNDFTLSGFSYGAQKAFEYALNSKNRIDKLQLFSPAFFQTKDKKYKRMQLLFFKKDSTSYCNNFLKNCVKPSAMDISNYFDMGRYEELEALLFYEWDKQKLQELKNRGINIEVYLGEKDEIIDSFAAKEFFKEFGTVYFIKNVGHILNNE